MSFSRGSSWPRNQTWVSYVSCTGRQVLYTSSTWEACCHKYTTLREKQVWTSKPLWCQPMKFILKGNGMSFHVLEYHSKVFMRTLMTTRKWVSGLQRAKKDAISSVQFSCSVLSDSLWPHGLQHARLPCPSSTPRACSNSCPLSWWHHPIISSSVVPFSSCLQSFPESGSFQMSQFFASGNQNIGASASASASVLPVNIQDWFPLGLTGLISLQSKGLSRVFSNITVQNNQFFTAQLSLYSNSHIHTWLLEKHSFD